MPIVSRPTRRARACSGLAAAVRSVRLGRIAAWRACARFAFALTGLAAVALAAPTDGRAQEQAGAFLRATMEAISANDEAAATRKLDLLEAHFNQLAATNRFLVAQERDRIYCPPPGFENMTRVDKVEAFARFLTQQPDFSNQPVGIVVIAVMISRFPC